MAMLRVVIVDDEPPARSRLRQLLAEAGNVLVLGEAGDGEQARAMIDALRPDVVFLDVDMPERSGTEVAGALADPKPFIVFATAFEQYALAAFAVDATDYLLKPITRGRLAATLDRVRDRMSRHSDLEKELVAASTAQSWLLPRVFPTSAYFDCAALTIAARGVGGDFYLAQRRSDDRITLALGDVAGKGMSAGLLASSLQARLESVARHAGDDATAIVADVNSTLVSTGDTARFATLIYLDLDTDSRSLHVVNAGHLPMIVLQPDGERQLVESNGPALGILRDAEFESAHVHMTAGSIAVLYSDGVTEALNENGEEFGEAGVTRELERGRALSASALCRSLLDAVHAHRGGGPVTDDATVMVIKSLPEGSQILRTAEGSDPHRTGHFPSKSAQIGPQKLRTAEGSDPE
jgi:serine phosphatase RsbU (regulator of sigma subunit)